MVSRTLPAAVAAVALAGGLVFAAVAQEGTGPADPAGLSLEEVMATRVAIMRENGGLLRQAGGLSGDAAIAAAATLQANFAALPAYFPEGSESATALPVIWERLEDFTAIFADAEAGAVALGAAAASGDTAAYTAALQQIGGTCGQCHAEFRGR